MDAKKIADKYIARDGSRPTSVPVVKVRRDGWFWCKHCGKEEKIYAGAPEGYVPGICVECGRADRENETKRRAEFMGKLAEQLKELLPLADRELEERKIAANEGRYAYDTLDSLRKAIEKVRDRLPEIEAKSNPPRS